jgi:hypothetical protein
MPAALYLCLVIAWRCLAYLPRSALLKRNEGFASLLKNLYHSGSDPAADLVSGSSTLPLRTIGYAGLANVSSEGRGLQS